MKNIIFILLSFLLSFPSISKEQLYTTLDITKLDTNRVKHKLIYQGINENNNRSKLNLYRESEKHIDLDSSYYAIINHEISLLYRELGNYDSAYFFLDLAEHFAERRIPSFLKQCYGNHSVLNLYQNNFDMALKWRLKCTVLSENKTDSILSDYNFLLLYIKVSDTTMAHFYLNKLILETENNPDKISSTIKMYIWLNAINYSSHRQDKIDYFNRIQTLKDSIPSHHWLNVLINKAHLYQGVDNMEAIDLYYQIIKESKKITSKVFLIWAKLGLVEVYLMEKDYKKADTILSQVEMVDVETRFLKEYYNLAFLTKMHANKNEEALFFSNLKFKLIDSIYSADKEKKYVEWSTQFRTDLKEAENKLLNKKNELQRKEAERKQGFNAILIIISFSLIVIITLIYIQLRIKIRNEELLQLKNEIIANNYKDLEIANRTKKKLFGLIAHDLLNPYQSILTYTSKLDEDILTLSKSEVSNMIKLLKFKVSQNFKFVNSLLIWSKSQSDNIIIENREFHLLSLLEEIIKPYDLLILQKELNVKIETNGMEYINSDKNILSIICSNLLSNSIKNTAQHGEITITTSRNKNGKTSIVFRDYGIGIEASNLKRIRLMFHENIKHKEEDEFQSLGLIICSDLLRLLKGSFNVESEIGKGTTIFITF